ncbi:MAG: carboxynorspermidine decarboxylase [Kiritimatiellae bacterium]|nr:carboxynorspermidine decarboxylase [Kiritimatiellia bacterium]
MRPQYRIDLDRLAETAATARANADRLGVRLLMALKGFPLPAAFPTLAPYVEGVTASGLFEARLGRLMGKEIHVHSPAYADDEIGDLCETCTHIVFNSLGQLRRFGPVAKGRGLSVGLRLNPGFSSADCLKYDPCCPDSRFGVMADELEGDLGLIDGLHVHALCEGYADDFAGMVERLVALLDAPALRALLPRLKWINLGGGEVIDDPGFATPRAVAAVGALKALGDFNAMIEPSEYMVRYSGSLVAHVLDVIRREEKDIAVLDVSASCHATDLILFDMRADVLSPAQADGGRRTILGCVSCLAGDVIGEYRFAKPLEVGDTVVLGGLGCYSFAQQSWFNGIRHPDVVLVSRAGGERTVLSWGCQDYLREFWRAADGGAAGDNML